MDDSFVHLHVHSHYSFWEGTAPVEALVRQATSCGMEALALTDSDLLSGALSFARAARAEGLRPIAGMSLTLEGGHRLTLLAPERGGYESLCRLSSLQWRRPGGDPRGIGLQDLAERCAGLFILTGGRGGPLWPLAAQGRGADLLGALDDLRQLAGPDRVFVEVQRLDRRDDRVLSTLREAAQELSLPLVATHEVRYLHPEESDLYRLLTAVRSGRRMDDAALAREAPAGWHLRTGEEMRAHFRDLPEALRGNAEVASRCGDVFPEAGEVLFLAEDVSGAEESLETLRKTAEGTALQRYGDPLPQAVSQRLEEELADAQRRGIAPLLLMLGEGLQRAGQEGLLPHVAGPAAGSLLLHLLSGSPLDPLEHLLSWELFLTPEDRFLPILHLLVDGRRRDALVALLQRCWGEGRAIEVGEPVLLSSERAWRVSAQAYGLGQERAEALARNVPWGGGEEGGDDRPVWDLLQARAEGQAELLAAQGGRVLAGRPVGPANRAMGLAVAPRPLAGLVPVIGQGDGRVLSQYGAEGLRFLGAAVLRVEEEQALSLLVQAGRWTPPELPRPPEVPQRDDPTAALLRAGRTLGCYRLERPGMRRLLRGAAPVSPTDLASLLALYRPAPLRSGLAHTFLVRLRGEEALPATPCLDEITHQTQGLLLFHEQVWQLAREVLRWPREEAWAFFRNLVRPASPGERGRWRAPFLRRMVELHGLERPQAEELWEGLGAAAPGTMSRARATAVALLAWWTAYLKAQDAAAFMTALLSAGAGAYALPTYLAEARRLGLEVRPPHVERSGRRFVLERRPDRASVLWMGLEAVRGLSQDTIEAILRERERAPFASVDDFLERVRPAPVEAERLARVGALDGLGPGRSAIFRQVRWQTQAPPEQMLLPLEFVEEGEIFFPEEILAAEREILGVAVSVHPLDLVEERLSALRVVSSGGLSERVGRRVVVAGVVARLRPLPRLRPEGGGMLTLEDREGHAEVLLPWEIYRQLREDLRPAAIVVVRGSARREAALAGEVGVVAEEVEVW